jgi:alpha-L-fucosidase
MGRGFAYTYDDEYKSTKRLLRLLIDIVSKGGNLALNVAPQPDGRLPLPALRRMKEMGAWLRQYGDAIYGTRVCAPYATEDFAFTQKAAEGKVYAFYLREPEAGAEIVIPYTDKRVEAVKNMTTGERMPFEAVSGGIKIKLNGPAPSDRYGGEHIAEVFEIGLA